ncbi:hypothetical protein ACFLZP_00060 [Patescibacteria group bacterium]
MSEEPSGQPTETLVRTSIEICLPKITQLVDQLPPDYKHLALGDGFLLVTGRVVPGYQLTFKGKNYSEPEFTKLTAALDNTSLRISRLQEEKFDPEIIAQRWVYVYDPTTLTRVSDKFTTAGLVHQLYQPNQGWDEYKDQALAAGYKPDALTALMYGYPVEAARDFLWFWEHPILPKIGLGAFGIMRQTRGTPNKPRIPQELYFYHRRHETEVQIREQQVNSFLDAVKGTSRFQTLKKRPEIRESQENWMRRRKDTS